MEEKNENMAEAPTVDATEQKPQFRVQMLPRIKTVAVPLFQHSPRFGQFAL